MSTTTEFMAYAGRERCGCVQTIVVDDPAHAESTAKEIAKWVRRGATVERVTTQDVRAGRVLCFADHRTGCPCEPGAHS